MRYALINDSSVEAAPKLNAVCRCCNLPVIAKCGRFKVWHWAHKTKDNCDQWWESETSWHRAWKEHFPKDWQEVIQYDPVTQERHIADIRTDRGLVIEFQHSILKKEELVSREQFYENMVWVVDGCRSEFDAIYFKLGLGSEPLDLPDCPTAFPFSWYGPTKLIKTWCSAKHPVFLDFGEEILWQLIWFDNTKNCGVTRPVVKSQQIIDFTQGTRIPRLV